MSLVTLTLTHSVGVVSARSPAVQMLSGPFRRLVTTIGSPGSSRGAAWEGGRTLAKPATASNKCSSRSLEFRPLTSAPATGRAVAAPGRAVAAPPRGSAAAYAVLLVTTPTAGPSVRGT